MNASAKAFRELSRIAHQLTDPMLTPIDVLLTAWHDARFDSRVRMEFGAPSLSSRIAIYHVFQPQGVSESSFATLRHLADKRYSIVLTSNAEISDADFERLTGHAALIIVRPNFGHDFGGYRDAVKVLNRLDVKLERLLFLNDSIWFPLSNTNELLREMENSTKGLTGPMFEKKDGRSHQGHFESYMMSLGEDALKVAQFSEYWEAYRLTSARRKVLSMGEKAFSRTLLDSGVASAEFCSRQKFIEKMRGADEGFLFDALLYAEHYIPTLEQRRKSLVSKVREGNFRTAAISHVEAVAAKGNIQENFPYAAMTLFDLPFLKKRNQPSTVAMRRAYWRAVRADKLPPPHPNLETEIREADLRS